MKQGKLALDRSGYTCNCVFRNFSFNDVHVDGARVIAEACKQAGVERLIHCSSLGASLSSPSTFLQSKVTANSISIITLSLVTG